MTEYTDDRPTWILFVLEIGQSDQLPRTVRNQLRLGFGGLSNLIAEHWSYRDGDRAPKTGDHLRQYTHLETPGEGISHGRDGDWQVTHCITYPGELGSGEFREIVLAYCQYAPIDPEWQKLNLGAPLAELETASMGKDEFVDRAIAEKRATAQIAVASGPIG